MKVELGKKYAVRNKNVKYVEILHIDQVMNSPILGKVYYHRYGPDYSSWMMNGKYFESGNPSDMDLIAEYAEPNLQITAEHVGRKVKTRRGDICLVTEFSTSRDFPVGYGSDHTALVNGHYTDNGTAHELDIVELI